jgi:hypothetical protein
MKNPFAWELGRLKRYRNRNGRCHELAIRLVCFTTRDDIVLVQGTIFVSCEGEGEDRDIWHSWIEHVPTGMILDPVDAQVYEVDEYRDLYDHEVMGKYTSKEVSRKMYEDRRGSIFFPARDAGVADRGRGGLTPYGEED